MSTSSFHGSTYIARNLAYHWRIHVAVTCGVLVAAAVLTGALLVGDSVRASLRRLTMERLGAIDTMVVGEHFFSGQRLADAKAAIRETAAFSSAEGVILLPQVNLERRDTANGQVRRARHVTVLGCEPSFWRLSEIVPADLAARDIPERSIVLNEPLAEALQAQVGDRVAIRVASDQRLAGDNTMAHRDDRIQSLVDLQVVAIVPARGLARFSLQANQATPLTAWMRLESLQAGLDQPEKINAICLTHEDTQTAVPDIQVLDTLNRIQFSLDDAGLRLRPIQTKYWNETENREVVAFSYWSLTSDSLLFPDAAEEALRQALEGWEFQTVFTYLANSISVEQRAAEDPANSSPPTAIPYSTIAAVENEGSLSPLWQSEEVPGFTLSDNDIVLHAWAADDLSAKVGDTIAIQYFAPETTHGDPVEHTARFVLKHIVPLTDPLTPYRRNEPARYVSPPTRLNDPAITPEVPGITDQVSIDSWDAPFPFDYRRIRKPKDDIYWDKHRTTPKAFISKQAGERLWGSRFGQTSGFRIAYRAPGDEAMLRQRIERAIRTNPEAFGLRPLQVKRDGLSAARGTTPFQVLFLGFSLFLIASALMLVGLLFRLGVEQRASEWGLLQAMGFSLPQIRRWSLGEGLVIATIGSLAGGLLGIVYAALMLHGLRTWWVDAIVTPFLQLAITPVSLTIGIITGIAVSAITIAFSLRGMQHVAIPLLLAGEASDAMARRTARAVNTPQRGRFARTALAISSGVCAYLATRLSGEAQAGAFFAAGACALSATLWQISAFLRHNTDGASRSPNTWNTRQFIWRNIARNPQRSVLTLGLMACATFLIVAISAFRVYPTQAGSGGWSFIAQADHPVFEDLSDEEVQRDLFGNDASRLGSMTLRAARAVAGDDASCRNLYRAQRPRLLGLPATLRQSLVTDTPTPFRFAANAAKNDEERANPWSLLSTEASAPPIPVILDKNTAMYGLQLYGGIGEEFEIDYGLEHRLRFRVVGLLSNSVLQGMLIVSEENLLRHFPQTSGYQFFFIRAEPSSAKNVAALLEQTLSDHGFATQRTEEILAGLLSIQNTYLATFQSLGGLGLVLGSLGMMAVQWRSVLERRREFALLQAIGFGLGRIRQLVFYEHLALLLGGLSVGVLGALVVVLPQAWTTDVQPPWSTLAIIVPGLVLLGLVTGTWAVRPLTRLPMLESLRAK